MRTGEICYNATMWQNIFFVLASIFLILLITVLVATVVLGILFLLGIRRAKKNFTGQTNELMNNLFTPRPGRVNLATFAPLLPLLPFFLRMMKNWRKKQA